VTLILTYVSGAGIIQAADSAISAEDLQNAGTGRKVFPIPYLRAGLSLAGSYTVDDEGMDTWMPRFISEYAADPSPSLGGFAEQLRARLQSQMTPGERRGACFYHIAGYVDDKDGHHPAFYYVGNATRINERTGAYEGIGPTFHVREDLWTRDCSDPEIRAALAEGRWSWRYFNGFPPGRIAYLGLTQVLGQAYGTIWGNPEWKFRPPGSLDELAALVELDFSIIATMFRMSEYPGRIIGGPIQTLRIPAGSGEMVTHELDTWRRRVP
jgi:hypothetical protein